MTNRVQQLAAPDDQTAAALRGFGPLGIAAILIILAGNALFVPLSALLVLAWAHVSRTPWREIGYARPKSWIGSAAIGVVFGVCFKLSMKIVVMPLLGAPPINPAYHFLAGNTAALPVALYAVVIGAGFGEETIFRGYLFERMGKLLGSSSAAKAGIVLLTSAWFAAAHYSNQGIYGVEQAAFTGLAFGSIFAVTGRLFMLICAHAAFDLAALAIIYFDVEAPFAHLLFR